MWLEQVDQRLPIHSHLHLREKLLTFYPLFGSGDDEAREAAAIIEHVDKASQDFLKKQALQLWYYYWIF